MLPSLIHAGSCLVESTRKTDSTTDLKGILILRLNEYNVCITVDGARVLSPDITLEQLQLETAYAAFYVVERVQCILDEEPSSASTDTASPEEIPVIGTRDLATLRTLLSIIFKWLIDTLLTRMGSSWPRKSPNASKRPAPRITTFQEDYKLLFFATSRLISLLFPRGVKSSLPQTLITTTILTRYLPDILRPCIVLGWFPKSMVSESMSPLDVARPFAIRLLEIMSPSETIVALGALMSSISLFPHYSRRMCAIMMSQQLMRPEGVHGLCSAVFGEGGSVDDAPLEKLENVSRVLASTPSGVENEKYMSFIVPKVLALLNDNSPPAHKRAAAFTISRMLASDDPSEKTTLASRLILPRLHEPFFTMSDEGQDTTNDHLPPTPAASLNTLIQLMTNTDPSPIFLATILSPIVAEMYSLLAYLDDIKTSEPITRENLRSLLATWGRIIGQKEGIDTLWLVLQGAGGYWHFDVAQGIRKIYHPEQKPSLTLFTPEDLRRADEDGELDVDSNLLNLRPNPNHFVQFLKSISRPDISADIFVRLLEGYRDLKSLPDSDPMRTVLYLQLIIQMQSHLVEGNSSSSILSKPEHILSFIKHALELESPVTETKTRRQKEPTKGLAFDDLRFVPEEDGSFPDGDSDDEQLESTSSSPDDEMTDTAINLLLAILEANQDLSARNAPVLNDIFSLLEPLAGDMSHPSRPIACESRLVMTARLASTSTSRSTKSTEQDEVQAIYQKSLKLLQDPILPVRAHGLLLLRQLVSNQPRKTPARPPVDPALIPAILSVFLQAIQDDDSYMFLNAVQGLAAMVDGFGKEVLVGIVRVYTQGLDGIQGANLAEQELNTRIRVGEALEKVIRRCGDALGIYVDILVPSLFDVVRRTQLPTALRTSAISLLAQCEKTNPLALLPYTTDILEAMVDLLQLESAPAGDRRKEVQSYEEETVTMDKQPTTINSKLPPLRRAALHFVSLLLQANITQIYESQIEVQDSFSSSKRMKTVLAYVASTDADDVVRVMAREAMDSVKELEQAILDV